jgi:hypothetical protein
MRAKRKHPNSANRKSKLQRHSKKSRRQQTQRASAVSSSEAAREALPATTPVDRAPALAECAPSADVVAAALELDVTPLESKFFELEEPAVVPDVVPEEDTQPVWLSPESLMRRSKYRRHVARLMTGLSMFTVVTLVMRIASGL